MTPQKQNVTQGVIAGVPKLQQTKDGLSLVTDIYKTTMSAALPNTTNTNTVNYVVNHMKKQIPDPAPGSGDPAEDGPKKTGDPKRDAELKKK